jgi:hypothetical protein
MRQTSFCYPSKILRILIENGSCLADCKAENSLVRMGEEGKRKASSSGMPILQIPKHLSAILQKSCSS